MPHPAILTGLNCYESKNIFTAEFINSADAGFDVDIVNSGGGDVYFLCQFQRAGALSGLSALR